MMQSSENENNRVIDFLCIPSFMVAVESIKNPSLKCRPSIVAPLKSDSAKVWDVSELAKSCGVRKGMDLTIAKRLCRDIEIINPNPDLYKSIHQKILFKISRLTPIFEDAKWGRIYLDFSGFEKLYGEPLDFAKQIEREIKNDFRLSVRLGISNNKLIAKAATHCDFIQGNILKVSANERMSFLDPFPNDILPVIKDFKQQLYNPLANIFEDLNLLTVADLKRLDLVTLEAFFVEQSLLIYEMSRGIDRRPVTPARLEDTISMDVHIEEHNDRGRILQLLYILADDVFYKLRESGKSCSEIKLGIRYSDFKYLARSISLDYHVQYAYEVYPELKKALDFLVGRRVAIRYLIIELGKINKNELQLSLFDDHQQKIMKSLDEINKRFPNNISKGRRGV